MAFKDNNILKKKLKYKRLCNSYKIDYGKKNFLCFD